MTEHQPHPKRNHWPQMLGSLLIAAAIVAIVIVAVTARIGPTSLAEQDAREERIDQRQDILDDRQDAREDRIEERSEGSGPG